MPEQETVVYVVLKNADQTEGKGPMILDKVFSLRILAEDYCRNKWGRGTGLYEIRVMTVLTQPFDLKKELQVKALAKLSPEERKALGW